MFPPPVDRCAHTSLPPFSHGYSFFDTCEAEGGSDQVPLANEHICQSAPAFPADTIQAMQLILDMVGAGTLRLESQEDLQWLVARAQVRAIQQVLGPESQIIGSPL